MWERIREDLACVFDRDPAARQLLAQAQLQNARPNSAVEALAPLRQFIRDHYRIVNMFGGHVLFELKRPSTQGASS